MGNQYECGCEHGGNCTRTTMCATQSAVEVLEVELADARQSATYWRKAYTRLEAQLDAVRDAFILTNATQTHMNMVTLFPDKFKQALGEDK